MKDYLEGAIAIARTVALCKPGVVSAYPITPQTHIVEELAKLVFNGELNAEFVNVESEHSAASVVLGSTATGVRSYTASSSQGLLLMAEVLFNIAGLRLPLVMSCVNRAISAPINIWNDQQDSMVVRDSGWIQMFAEDIQEACDMHVQAYNIAERKDILLPVMVCLDGYILSHGYEIVDLPDPYNIEKFVPEFNLPFNLDPKKPLTLGVLSDPQYYMETRYAIHDTMNKEVISIVPDTVKNFEKLFGRKSGGLIEEYKLDDAQKVIVSMGSICGTIKDAIDDLRSHGEKIGLLRIITYRPFPEKQIIESLKNIREIAVLDRAISLGAYGPLYTDLKAIFQSVSQDKKISGYIIGLGGRDITKTDIFDVSKKLSKEPPKGTEFVNIDIKKVEVEI